eukprot:4828475-Pyramimonas_sp.AAC.1
MLSRRGRVKRSRSSRQVSFGGVPVRAAAGERRGATSARVREEGVKRTSTRRGRLSLRLR